VGLGEVIHPPKPLLTRLGILQYCTVFFFVFFFKVKENRKPKLHYFTPKLKSKLKISPKLHFTFGKPQANRILKIPPVFSSTPQGTIIII
jgi:hypothetical protein